MSKKFTSLFLMLFFVAATVYAQDFVRGTELPVPDADLNVGGIGNMVAGVDFDGDGMLEVYLVNNNWGDTADELVPRIYKYEHQDTGWALVWKAIPNVPKQNTWPPLEVADLDGDGKMELVWGVINNTDADNPNPARILVYEAAGDGSDNLGVADGDNFLPNAEFTLTEEDNQNIRPTRFVLKDIDGDDTTEVIFNDRKGASGSGWYFGVVSVDDIPDNGGGTETWKVEASGKTLEAQGDTIKAENKWDVAVLGKTIYLYDETQVDRVRWADTAWVLLEPQKTANLEGAAPFNSVQVLDIDGNAQEEIIAVSYWNNYAYEGGTPGAWIYQYDADGDSLVGTKIADLSAYWTGRGATGSDIADIDLDGHLDYIFGSRDASPNAAIFRLEYVGAQDGVADPANWELSVIDSLYNAESGIWNVIRVANVDDDPNLEVLYTSSTPAGGLFGGPQPIVILDNTAPVETGPWVKKDLPWKFDKVIVDWGYGLHGIVLDKYNRLWVSRMSSSLGGIRLYTTDGDSITSIDTIHVKTQAGTDTSFTPRWGRGMEVDPNGNVVYSEDYILTIDVDALDGSKFIQLDASRLKPGIDADGFIYSGKVVGITPVVVIDPTTYEVTQEITLDPAHGYARGMDVSADGKMIITGNLDAAAHPLNIYTTEDYITYTKTDSIYKDTMGQPILTTQSVTINRDPMGRFWVSQDNSYGADNSANAMVMFDFSTMEYGYVYMPDEITDPNGPRGAAFSAGGDTMYVCSWNSGKVYRYVKTGTAIDDDGNAYLPQGFQLSQNYPNPFNPTTEIKFTVAKAGDVSITVYNMLGQKVATLVNGKMPMGTYTVTFDASKLASGTYVYVLKANGAYITKKMTLLK